MRWGYILHKNFEFRDCRPITISDRQWNGDLEPKPEVSMRKLTRKRILRQIYERPWPTLTAKGTKLVPVRLLRPKKSGSLFYAHEKCECCSRRKIDLNGSHRRCQRWRWWPTDDIYWDWCSLGGFRLLIGACWYDRIRINMCTSLLEIRSWYWTMRMIHGLLMGVWEWFYV